MGGIMKVMNAGPDMANMIGGAAHAMGLTFLSTTVWFWLAAIGEILAGVLLIAGLFLPLASLLMLIIMIVAFVGAHKSNMQEGMSTILFMIAALGLGFAGPGKYSVQALCGKKCGKGCSTGTCAPAASTSTTPEAPVASTPEVVNA